MLVKIGFLHEATVSACDAYNISYLPSNATTFAPLFFCSTVEFHRYGCSFCLPTPCLSFFVLHCRSSISSRQKKKPAMSSTPIPGPLPPDVNRGSDLVIISWLTVSIALLLVSVRFYIRGILRKNLGWDDYLILLAIVSCNQSGPVLAISY